MIYGKVPVVPKINQDDFSNYYLAKVSRHRHRNEKWQSWYEEQDFKFIISYILNTGHRHGLEYIYTIF